MRSIRRRLYEQITPGRRIHLHRSLAACQEAAWASRAPEIAAELSVHFERGRILAARSCTVVMRRLMPYGDPPTLKRSRPPEESPQTAESLPGGRWRLRRELDLRTTLGTALMAVKGYGAVEVEANYLRARKKWRNSWAKRRSSFRC